LVGGQGKEKVGDEKNGKRSRGRSIDREGIGTFGYRKQKSGREEISEGGRKKGDKGRERRTTCPSTTEKSPVPSKAGSGNSAPGKGGKVL
jgi:hypothetical protein